MKKLIFLFAAMAFMVSCSQKHVYTEKDTSAAIGYSNKIKTVAQDEPQRPRPTIAERQPEGMMPKATAFKMNGDYQNNVAITLDANGNITYYPAPSDISSSSRPVDLGNGWWLNQQGIGPNSVFTSYTFEDYSQLPAVPTREELKASILPGAEVIQMIELPFTISEASQKIPEIKSYLKSY